MKRLPFCEHQVELPCFRDPATKLCDATCGGQLECCSKTCQSKCHECRERSMVDSTAAPSSILRTTHQPHECDRSLYCQHLCGLSCHSGKEDCNDSCQEQCRQGCSHQTCTKGCSTPCPPCMEPCTWNCIHHSCPVPCGSVSSSNKIHCTEAQPSFNSGVRPPPLQRTLPNSTSLRSPLSFWLVKQPKEFRTLN